MPARRQPHNPAGATTTTVILRAPPSSDRSHLSYDQAYHYEQIRQEQAAMHERVLFDSARHNAGPSQETDQQRAFRLTRSQSDPVRLYRPPIHSNMTPMERFCSPSTSTEPNGFLFRHAMQKAGLHGSFESVNAREQFVRDRLPHNVPQGTSSRQGQPSDTMHGSADETLQDSSRHTLPTARMGLGRARN